MYKFSVVLMSFVFFQSSTMTASATPSFEVACGAGKWIGVSLFLKDGERTFDKDKLELPETIYSIDPYEDVATIYTAGKTINAKILNRYDGSLSYTVISYVFGGVNYTDTIYQNGHVIVQYSKMSLWSEPYASTVSRQCSVI